MGQIVLCISLFVVGVGVVITGITLASSYFTPPHVSQDSTKANSKP